MVATYRLCVLKNEISFLFDFNVFFLNDEKTAEMVFRGIPKQVGSKKAKIKIKGMKDIDR